MASKDKLLAELKEHLDLAQQRMKLFVDHHKREVPYELGDRVFLKLQPYQMKSLARKLNEKPSSQHYGPFQIIKKLGQLASMLALPPECKLQPVFHVTS